MGGQQPPMHYSGPMPGTFSQPMMDPAMSNPYPGGPQSYGGEHARLAVMNAMILNDLNSLRRKVVDYMHARTNQSVAGGEDPMERARVQDALA